MGSFAKLTMDLCNASSGSTNESSENLMNLGFVNVTRDFFLHPVRSPLFFSKTVFTVI